jgi:hypothetical protein
VAAVVMSPAAANMRGKFFLFKNITSSSSSFCIDLLYWLKHILWPTTLPGWVLNYLELKQLRRRRR